VSFASLFEVQVSRAERNLINVCSSMIVTTSETGDTFSNAAARGMTFFPNEEEVAST